MDTVSPAGVLSTHSRTALFVNRKGEKFTINLPPCAVTTNIRETGLIELICKHGVGHPAPESVAWKDEHGPAGAKGSWHVHGCDGCCCEVEIDIS